MLCFIISIEKYNFFLNLKLWFKINNQHFLNQLLQRGKNDVENLIIAFLLDMAQFGRVFWSIQNHRVKLKSTFHGESLKCWMVSKFLLGEIEIWELSLALQISANQQALQTVSGTVKKRTKLLWKSNNHGYEITVWALL